MIPYGRQDINDEDIQAVVDVLKSDYITQGPKVPEFEKTLAAYCGVKYGVAANSATSALHIACLALGLGQGDLLWTSPITFVASANCALYCGAEVDFVDIDSKTYNISVSALKAKLEMAEKNGRLPKIVIPVHLAGQSCEMAEIHKLSQRYGFKIIEDASHAIGGKYLEQPVGNCRFSDITIFSFHPVKIITTAEGGMAMTNDPELNHKMNLLRSHGITREPQFMKGETEGPWYYQQIDLGYNYRMTEMQAALGTSQMKRLDQFILARHSVASFYNSKLAGLPLQLPYQHPDTHSAYHLYPLKFDCKVIGKNRLQIFNELRQQGIGVNVHYIPVNKQPYHRDADCPVSQDYYENSLSIPMYSSLTEEQLNQVIVAVRRVCQK